MSHMLGNGRPRSTQFFISEACRATFLPTNWRHVVWSATIAMQEKWVKWWTIGPHAAQKVNTQSRIPVTPNKGKIGIYIRATFNYCTWHWSPRKNHFKSWLRQLPLSFQLHPLHTHTVAGMLKIQHVEPSAYSPWRCVRNMHRSKQ